MSCAVLQGVFDDMMLMLVDVFDQLLYFVEGGNWTTCDAPHRGLHLAIELYESFGLPMTTQGCWVAVLINHKEFILVPN